MKKEITILGIESSCDETAAAVVKNGRTLCSNVIHSQIAIHRAYGGVVPEIASRNHVLAIDHVVQQALSDANVTLTDIDAIAVTYGAGLVGALLVGVSYAKALCYATQKPCIAVNHIRGHIAANYLANPKLEPPFLCLITSGGHTALLSVDSYQTHRLIGTTVDDAVGEAFDKVARVLGLPYPGGVQIDRLAKNGQAVIAFPLVLDQDPQFRFSYSGLKTAVINYLHREQQAKRLIQTEDVCASFQKAAVDILISHTKRAIDQTKSKQLVLAGGVAANSYLRSQAQLLQSKNLQVYLPPIALCTDNAAMIAAEGYYEWQINHHVSDRKLNVVPNLSLQLLN